MSNTLNLGGGKWAAKEGSLLAYNSENDNFKPLPFSFDRASSATRVNKDGLIETVGSGEPRIDYKDDSKGALLLEPSRTNYVTKSERLDQWSTASNATIEYGFEDPFKGNKAVKATSSSTAQAYQIYQGFSSAGTYNFSIYAKKGTATLCRIDFAIPDNGYFIVNLETGESAGTSGFAGMVNTKIEPLDNDWYRISFTSTTVNPAYYRAGANNQEGFIYMAFAQIEQGSYATSYIPTQGSIGTRVAESCSNENLNVDYSGDYTLYLEYKTLSITEYNQFQFLQKTPSISYVFRIGNDINVGSSFYTTQNTLGFNKFALSVTSIGSYKFYKNGVLLSSGSGLNANLETIKNTSAGGNVKDLKLYNTALTDQELINLTTI